MPEPTAPGPEQVTLPEGLLKRLLAEVRDPAELKVVLAVARLHARQGSRLPAVPELALFQDPELQRGLRPAGTDRTPLEEITRGIELAVARGLLLRVRTSRHEDEAGTRWLLLATPEAQALVRAVRRQPAAWPEPSFDGATIIEIERPNVFRLYEQNIGMLTPLLAERLVEALELYPQEWIEDAIAEAVSYGRRNWRYIQRILERWALEGRQHETDQGRQGPARPLDPDKYVRGKYAPLFRQRG